MAESTSVASQTVSTIVIIHQRDRKMFQIKSDVVIIDKCISLQLFSKLGYSILRELPHSEFIGSDGLPVFAPLDDGATTARFVFKRLH